MSSLLSFIPGLSLDTLLSVPFVSYFILPSVSASWPTSLNLIFFTLLWTTIVWSYRPLLVELFSTLAVRLIFFLAPCAFFLAFDTTLPSVAASMKANGARALPFQAARQSGQSAHTRLASVAGLAVANVLLSVLVQAAIEALLTEILQTRSALRMSSLLPAPWTLIKDVVRTLVLRGVLTYYIHRILLHSQQYSPSLSRAHKAYAHSLRATLPFSAAYDHPLVHLLHRWLPLYLPAVFYRLHLITYLVSVALVSMEEALVYSGYSVLPSTILLTGMARRSEKHLLTGGRGNYGPYGFLDWLHGTSIDDYDIFDDIREEADKHDVKGKAHQVMDKADGALRGNNGDSDDRDQNEAPNARPRRTKR